MSFVEVEDEETLYSVINNKQRIMVVEKEIDKRILSVAWLYENNIYFRGISIKPYKLDGKIIMDVNQIVPPNRLEEFFINRRMTNKDRIINIYNQKELDHFIQISYKCKEMNDDSLHLFN